MTDNFGNKIKYCSECDRHRLLKFFHKSTRTADGFRRLCKDCTSLENKETRQLLRLEVLIHYSSSVPQCECCEEKNLEFLSIDHINGGGGEQRKADPSSIKIYAWLKRNKFPKGYRVLCMNCNFAHGRYGYCPHKLPSQLINELPENYDQRKYKRWSAKVTLNDVLEIRRRAQEGESSASLSKAFEITQHSINNIVARRRWKDV
jgi:hypothetical protein